jgi:hypothetical protein
MMPLLQSMYVYRFLNKKTTLYPGGSSLLQWQADAIPLDHAARASKACMYMSTFFKYVVILYVFL